MEKKLLELGATNVTTSLGKWAKIVDKCLLWNGISTWLCIMSERQFLRSIWKGTNCRTSSWMLLRSKSRAWSSRKFGLQCKSAWVGSMFLFICSESFMKWCNFGILWVAICPKVLKPDFNVGKQSEAQMAWESEVLLASVWVPGPIHSGVTVGNWVPAPPVEGEEATGSGVSYGGRGDLKVFCAWETCVCATFHKAL